MAITIQSNHRILQLLTLYNLFDDIDLPFVVLIDEPRLISIVFHSSQELNQHLYLRFVA